MAEILLYNYTNAEAGALRLMLRATPGVLVSVVPRAAFGMTLEQVLAGEKPTVMTYGQEFDRKMAVLAGAQGQLLHSMINACALAVKEPVLRAMLTETNRTWTGSQLYEELASEERALGG